MNIKKLIFYFSFKKIKMSRKGTIDIKIDDQVLTVRKANLYRFSYFRALFEADVKEVVLPKNEFNEAIKDLILEADCRYVLNNNFYDDIACLQASYYLGTNPERFIKEIKDFMGPHY